jgi:hypothetical protein
MATFDQLTAEQRAIIELVLKQDQTYDQLGELLGLPTSRVRSMAREALVQLSPVSAAAVDSDWRDQLADYLLNQQAGPEATATRGHLRRSEAARGWARSVEDSLDHLYRDGSAPEIPTGDGAGSESRDRRPRRERPARPARELSPEAQRAIRKRRIAAAAVAGLVLVLALVVWPFQVFGGDDDKSDASSTNAQSRIVGQLVLRPTAAARGRDTVGVGVIADTAGKLELIVQAKLPPTGRNQAYEVWLYNSPRDARSLGGNVTNRQGIFQGRQSLPRNFDRYRFIDISREKVDGNAGHSGVSILRERISNIQAPTQGNAGQSTTPQGQGTTPSR